MRWFPRTHRQLGSRRSSKLFAFWPVTVTSGEHVWLERYQLVEEWSLFEATHDLEGQVSPSCVGWKVIERSTL